MSIADDPLFPDGLTLTITTASGKEVCDVELEPALADFVTKQGIETVLKEALTHATEDPVVVEDNTYTIQLHVGGIPSETYWEIRVRAPDGTFLDFHPNTTRGSKEKAMRRGRKAARRHSQGKPLRQHPDNGPTIEQYTP